MTLDELIQATREPMTDATAARFLRTVAETQHARGASWDSYEGIVMETIQSAMTAARAFGKAEAKPASTLPTDAEVEQWLAQALSRPSALERAVLRQFLAWLRARAEETR